MRETGIWCAGKVDVCGWGEMLCFCQGRERERECGRDKTVSCLDIVWCVVWCVVVRYGCREGGDVGKDSPGCILTVITRPVQEK